MVGVVIDQKLATLYELQTIYGLEDLFDLYEVVLVKSSNETISWEEAKIKR